MDLFRASLIFAVHNHAFVFLALSLAIVVTWLGALHNDATLPLRRETLRAALFTWLFVYPFLAQKRVYRQGWTLTAVKYLFIGSIYSVLLSLALAAVALIGAVAVSFDDLKRALNH